MPIKEEWMKGNDAVPIPDPGTPLPASLEPEYEWGKNTPLPPPMIDADGNFVHFKKFDDQPAAQSKHGKPTKALLWTFRDVSVTVYQDIPAVALRFMIDPVYGAGANYFPIVGLYDKAGPLMRHVGLWDQRLGQGYLWQPSCGSPYPQDYHFIYAAKITTDEWNDIGNVTWGWKRNQPTGEWVEC